MSERVSGDVINKTIEDFINKVQRLGRAAGAKYKKLRQSATAEWQWTLPSGDSLTLSGWSGDKRWGPGVPFIFDLYAAEATNPNKLITDLDCFAFDGQDPEDFGSGMIPEDELIQFDKDGSLSPRRWAQFLTNLEQCWQTIQSVMKAGSIEESRNATSLTRGFN